MFYKARAFSLTKAFCVISYLLVLFLPGHTQYNKANFSVNKPVCAVILSYIDNLNEVFFNMMKVNFCCYKYH